MTRSKQEGEKKERIQTSGQAQTQFTNLLASIREKSGKQKDMENTRGNFQKMRMNQQKMDYDMRIG